jgi:hypothetical protein
LFGFTQMNTAHNGTRLGQSLYKVCHRLGIVHKVRHTFFFLIIANSLDRWAISLVITRQTMERCSMNLLDAISKKQKRSTMSRSDISGRCYSVLTQIESQFLTKI